MLVDRIMRPDPVVVSPTDHVDEAFRRMVSNGIRHLPVMVGEKLVGIISDRDIRQSFIPSMATSDRQKSYFLPSSLSVADAMTDDPQTIALGTDVEDAAKIMFEHKISALPVMDGERLAGIITETDLLHLFIELLGMIKDSSRIDVLVRDDREDLRRILVAIKKANGHLVSIGISQVNEEEKSKVYFFRLERKEAGRVAPLLTTEGFQVVKVIDSL